MKIYTETMYEEYAEMKDYVQNNNIEHSQSFIEYNEHNYTFELWEFTTKDDFNAFVEKFSTQCITPGDMIVRVLASEVLY